MPFVLRGLRRRLAWMLMLMAGGASLVPQARGQSKPGVAAEEPAAILSRSKEVLGFARTGHSVVHYHAVAAAEQNYQSDRTYPPFFSAMQVKEAWLDQRAAWSA